MSFKVITPVATEPVTAAEAKLSAKIDTSADDTLVDIWITTAREMAEHYTGRALAEQTLEMALDSFPWPEDDRIRLDMPPVTSITSIKYTDLNGTEQTISASDYSLSLYGDSRYVAPAFAKYWPSTQDIPDAVRIRYVCGAATTPKAVKAAMLLMVGWLNEHRGSEMDASDIQPPAARALLDTVRVYG